MTSLNILIPIVAILFGVPVAGALFARVLRHGNGGSPNG
jgi:hypothetical protein